MIKTAYDIAMCVLEKLGYETPKARPVTQDEIAEVLNTKKQSMRFQPGAWEAYAAEQEAKHGPKWVNNEMFKHRMTQMYGNTWHAMIYGSPAHSIKDGDRVFKMDGSPGWADQVREAEAAGDTAKVNHVKDTAKRHQKAMEEMFGPNWREEIPHITKTNEPEWVHGVKPDPSKPKGPAPDAPHYDPVTPGATKSGKPEAAAAAEAAGKAESKATSTAAKKFPWGKALGIGGLGAAAGLGAYGIYRMNKEKET